MNPISPPLTTALAVILGAGSLLAQASMAGPRLFPRGVRTPGIQEVRFDTTTSAYYFTLKSATGAVLVQYRLPLQHVNMLNGVLRIEETTTGVTPMSGGGMMYRTLMPGASGVGRLLGAQDLAFGAATNPLHTATLLAHSYTPSTGIVSVTFRDDYLVGAVTVPAEKTYQLRLLGKSLEIHATANAAVNSQAQYNYAGFGFGPGEGLTQPNLAFHIPYMDSVPVFVSGNGVFVSRIVDWYTSSASEGVGTVPVVTGTTFEGECAPAVCRNDANEWNAPIDETVYLTVSNEVAEVFPVVDRPPSAYRMHMADRAVSQAAPGQLYSSDKAWLDIERSLGITEMAHIKWDWSKWPFNLNDQDVISPPPAKPFGLLWGTVPEWLAYADAAKAANWTFAPYFEETSNDYGYPNLLLQLPGSLAGSVLLTANPVYSAAESVRDAGNGFKHGWDTNNNLDGTNLAGQGHPTEVIGPHLRAAKMTKFATWIHGAGGFAVSGAHTDAATDIPDSNQVDQRKLGGFPNTIAKNLRWREESFTALKDGMEGPLFGENSHWRYKAFESYDAGLIDGTSRKIPIHWSPVQGPAIADNQDYLVVPDFELTEVLPKATGFFGMGWESHYAFAGPYGTSDKFVDGWDATLLSYGHAPYFGTNGNVTSNYWDWQRNVRSYFLCYGISKAMRTGKVTAVRYVDSAGTELTLSQALVQAAAGLLDLTRPHLVLRFDNGLEFKANHGVTNWITTVLGQNFVLPPNGFAGAAPGGLLAFSACNPASPVQPGPRIDYAFNPGHSQVLDQRGFAQSYNGFPGSLLPVPAGLPQFATVRPEDTIVVRDLRDNRAIYAANQVQGSIGLGPVPVPLSLAVAIDDTAGLSMGRQRLGVRAILTDGVGYQRDVTRLCTWTSSAPGTVSVNSFGGLRMLGSSPSSVTITANLPTLGFTGTRVVTTTVAPVMTALQTDALRSTVVFLSQQTDAACTVTLRLRNNSTGAIQLFTARSDPAKKSHCFAIQGLTPLTSYTATPTATDVNNQTTTGAALNFTTP